MRATTNPSIIDIVLQKQVLTTRPSVQHGQWDGASDHLPVSVQQLDSTVVRSVDLRDVVPRCKRLVPDILETATEHYTEIFPSVIAAVEQFQTPFELDSHVQNTNQVILHPWAGTLLPKKGKRSSGQWSSELQALVRQRSIFYKTARKHDYVLAWEKYSITDKKIKRGDKIAATTTTRASREAAEPQP